MALREIITLPNPVLRRKARKVTDFNPELQTLIDDMIETMQAEPGIGLAANQVGVSLRVIVVEYGEENEAGDVIIPHKLYVVVNPELTKLSPETTIGTEGCLSVPGYLGNVERHVSLSVKGFNRYGQPLTIKAKDWLARIFQHEVDHLDAILFVDRAEKVWRVENETGQVSAKE
jgi:peptide deformylase